MKKILLDENLDVRLKDRFIETDFEVRTVVEMRWTGLTNGELLKMMEKNGFNFLITCDKNLSSQQNLEKYSMNFIILDAPDNRYKTLLPFIDRAIKILSSQKSIDKYITI